MLGALQLCFTRSPWKGAGGVDLRDAGSLVSNSGHTGEYTQRRLREAHPVPFLHFVRSSKVYPNSFYVIDNATGACLLPGATITDFRGADHVFAGVRSDGRRIYTGAGRAFFPSVFPGLRVCPND